MNAYKVIDLKTQIHHSVIAHGPSCAYEIIRLRTKHDDMLVCDMNNQVLYDWEDEIVYG